MSRQLKIGILLLLLTLAQLTFATSVGIKGGTSTCVSGGSTPCVPTVDFVGAARPASGAQDVGIYISASAAAPSVAFSVSPVNFGTVPLTTPSTAVQVLMTNVGGAQLTFTAATITGTNAGDFKIQSTTCVSPLLSLGQCSYMLVFTPSAAGTRSANLTLNSNAAGSPQQLPLTGIGGTGALVFNPQVLNFGNILVGQCASPLLSTLTNTGNTSVTINADTTTGPNAADFPDGGTGSCPALITNPRTYTTNFPLTQNPISESGNWINGKVTGLDWSNVRTTPGIAFGTQTGSGALNDSTAVVGGTWNNDQQVTATVRTISHTQSTFEELELRLRTTITAHSIKGYEINFAVGPGQNYTQIVRWNGPLASGGCSPTGGCTMLSDKATGGGVVNGDVVRATFIGNVITVYKNNVQVNTATDSTFPSGDPGIGMFLQGANTAADYGFSSFTATEIGGGSGTLAPGASCIQSTKFCPSAANARSAQVNVGNTSPTNPQVLPLSGVGGTAVIGVTPTFANCGSQQVGTSSACQSFSMSNPGSATMSNIAISLTGANALSWTQTNNCPLSLAPSAGCTISLVFKPVSTGGLSANLQISSSATNSPDILPLTGTGTAASLTLTPTSANLGSSLVGVPTNPVTITAKNTGSGPIIISGIAASTSYNGTNVDCPISPSTLGAGVSCTVTVTGTPATTGAIAGTVTFTDNAVGSPHVATLTMNGTSPTITFLPASFNFLNQFVGQQSAFQNFTLANTGTGQATFAISLVGTDPGDYVLDASACPSPLGASLSCTVKVAFKPTTSGSRPAVLRSTDSASGSPHDIALSGTGVVAAPALCLSQSTIPFANQPINTSSNPVPVTVTNCGTDTLTVASVTPSSSFLENNNCTSVAVGATCTINGIFHPLAAGSLSGTITIVSNAGSSPDVIATTGFGTQLGATLTPSSVPFGHVLVSKQSSGTLLTLLNTSNISVAVNMPTITGANPGDFNFTGSCPPNLAAAASCTYSVFFKPTTTGSRAATFNQTFGTVGLSPLTVSMTGTGDPQTSTLVFNPTSLDFNNVTQGSPSQILTEQLESTGTATLNFSSITLTGTNASDYTIVADNCSGIPLAPGGLCTVDLSVTPNGLGARTANLHVASDSPASPQDLPLTVNGVAAPTPAITISPSSLSFSPPSIQTTTTSASQNLIAVNSGNADLVITHPVTLGGANPGDFTVSDNCGTVPAGLSCAATVNCTPQTAGSKSATVIFTSNAASSPDSIAISCTAFVGTPTLVLGNTQLTFLNVTVGLSSLPVPFNITNTGTATATGIVITASGPDFTVTDNCGGTLTQGSTCQGSVTFSPQALCGQVDQHGNCISNVHLGTATVVSNTSSSPQTVALQGTAVAVPPPPGNVKVIMGGKLTLGGHLKVGTQ